jgi:two-component system sensor histidine kinase/response regulator
MAYPIPENEEARLQALRQYRILGTSAETSFDRITALAARIFDMPIVLISLVGEERQWLKSHHGVDVCETDRDIAFCAHAILSPDVMVVENALLDPRFAENPLVVNDPKLRFYAGAPLITHDGLNIGTLCLIDTKPRVFTQEQRESLADMAAMAMREMDLRLRSEDLAASYLRERDANERFSAVTKYMPGVIFALDENGVYTLLDGAAVRSGGLDPVSVIGRSYLEVLSDAPDLRDCVTYALKGEMTSWIGEFQETCYETHGRATRDADGRITGLIAVSNDITLRRSTEQELRRVVLQTEHLLASLTSILIGVDETGLVTAWSAAASRLFGKASVDVVGKPFADSGVLWDWIEVMRAVRECKATSQVVRLDDLGYVRGDGTESILGVSINPITEASGRNMGFLVLAADVSRRRQEEEALREAELKFRSIFENAVEGIFQSTLDGRFISINPAFARIAGYDSPEALMTEVTDITQHFYVVPCQRKEFILRLITDGIINDFPIQFRRKDGDLGWITTSARTILDAQGQIAYLEGSVLDITERKRAEEGVRQLAAIVEASDDAIIGKTLDDVIVSWNPGAERLYGYTAEEAIGQQFGVLVPPAKSSDGEPSLIERLMRTDPISSFETARVAKDARIVDISVSISLIRNAEGEPVGVSSIARDITDQRQAQQELADTAFELEWRNWELAEARDAALAAARLKSEFLANMSHEIRTPMNGVIGMIDVLLNTPLDEGQYDCARTVKQCADALMTVINDILDFSKIEAGKMTIEAVEFTLHDLLEDVAVLLSAKGAEKGQELVCSLPPMSFAPTFGAGRLMGDPSRLRQVATNLLSNAVKFTDEGGEVVLGAELISENAAEAQWRIFVRDNGIGIPKARQEAIFESFTQADGSTTRKYGGTGLGLTICRQLVELMGGTLGVESEEGQGSTFFFTLTFEKQVTGQHTARLPRVLPPLRVLTVDESGECRRNVSSLLRAWGCEASEVADEAGALAMLSGDLRDGVDAVLIDAELGGGAARRLKMRASLADVPVILLAGREVRSQEEDAGLFAARVRKPLRQSDLFQTLSLLFGSGEPADRRDAERPAETRLEDAARSARILLTEDTPINQKVARRLLEQAGYDLAGLTIANHGAEAVAAVQSDTFDLILMDVQMPGMDGLAATAAIRAWERGSGRSRTPIIAMTAHAMSGDRDRCIEAGMDDYITKPINAPDLYCALNRHLASVTVSASPMEADDFFAEIAEDVLDSSRLKNLCGGDTSFEREMLVEFFESAPKMHLRCVMMHEIEDFMGLEHWAHTLKGASSAIGAVRLADRCQEWEALAVEEDAAGAADLAGKIQMEMDRVMVYLQERIEIVSALCAK